jgi:thiol-disulfide isomerase/thioredoxin
MIIPRRTKLSISIAAVFCIILTTLTGCTEKDNQTGDDFTFVTLDGETQRLSDFYGKVIVLDCMAVNCQPCMYQMFELKKISENYSNDDVSILSIDVWVSNGETATMLQDMLDMFKSQANLTLDWTFGLDDAEGTIQNTYAPDGVPTLYVIDKKGNIYYSHVGYESYTSLAVTLDEALGNK